MKDINDFINKISTNHIIIDVKQTWPLNLRELLQKNIQTIEDYINRENLLFDKKIKDECENEKKYYNRCYLNIYKESWKELKDNVDRLLKKSSIIGFHSTRLTEDEVDDIVHNGLKPLDSLFTHKRIERLRNKGLLSNETACNILQLYDANSKSREGHIFMFHCLKGLKCQYGLHRLFRAWGGEAIYCNFEGDESVFQELRGIGFPCIVICSIKYDEIDKFHDIPNRILRIYRGEENQDFDNWFNHTLNVLQVIKFSNPLFEILTDYKNWKMEI